MKNLNEKYIVLIDEEFGSKKKIESAATIEELNQIITDLNSKTIKTGQSVSEFARVFPKGSLYPTNYKDFTNEKNNKNRRKFEAPFYGDWFVQYETKTGKQEQLVAHLSEDFEYDLDDLAESGHKNFLILQDSESVGASYYYKRDIKKTWGDKKPLFN